MFPENELTERGKQIRRDTIKLALENGGYHWGGCFSEVEILIELFDNILTRDDVFILSKGHACWPLYVLLREGNLNPKLQGHPSYDPENGIHATTGSLGHGLPIAIGIALAKQIKGEPGQVFVLLGDGEIQEGTFWESLLIINKLKLQNLTVIIDMNGIQGSDKNVFDFFESGLFTTFGNIFFLRTNGHDQINLRRMLKLQTFPKVIFAYTTKGKGVSFMENEPAWHAQGLFEKNLKKALEELS